MHLARSKKLVQLPGTIRKREEVEVGKERGFHICAPSAANPLLKCAVTRLSISPWALVVP